MTETSKTYNGWKNYETWNVALWIDNEQGSYEYWRERAQEAYNDARDNPSANYRLTGNEPFTHDERAVFALSDELKDHFENEKDDLVDASSFGASMWSDLLNAALSEVDWHEIAEHMIDEVDKTESPDD